MSLRRWGDRFGVGGFESILWADLYALAPSAYQGLIFHVKDVGPAAGSLFISDGTYWVPLNGSVVLYAGAELGYSTTSSTEVEVADFGPLLKAGLFAKPGSFLRSMMRGRRTGTLATSGAPFIRIGWTGDTGSNLVRATSGTTSADSLRNMAIISRVNATQVRNNALQADGGGFAISGDTYEPNLRTLDAAVTTNVLGHAAVSSTPGAGETITLDELIIELIVP